MPDITDLTPSQRVFAEFILEAAKQPYLRIFLTTPGTGKTVLWNALEQYLRHNVPTDVNTFIAWLKSKQLDKTKIFRADGSQLGPYERCLNCGQWRTSHLFGRVCVSPSQSTT